MNNKKMIFHIPYAIDKNRVSGSTIRPVKILEAFRELGYEVDAVMGSYDLRLMQINGIKKNIRKGVKYDFLYSESSTAPTLLSSKILYKKSNILLKIFFKLLNKILRYISLIYFPDFLFIKYCKKKKIKTGIFYRDIYWNFDELYKKKLGNKLFFYKYDLKYYNKIFDIMFLPTMEMYNYIPIKFKGQIVELYPGAEKKERNIKFSVSQHKIKIIYVGGIGPYYRMHVLFKTVSMRNDVELTVCCRKSDWDKIKNEYTGFLNSNISVVHLSGELLEQQYLSADLASLIIEPTRYSSFAMNIKLFEYLSFGLPIIAINKTAVGSFIDNNNAGWCIEYSEQGINSVIDKLISDKQMISKKKEEAFNISVYHTWKNRAQKAEAVLLSK